MDRNTKTIRAGVDQGPHGEITPSLVTTSNFSYESYGKPRKYDYTRTANPTRDTLGQAIADLEGGFNSVITSSGLSALNLVFSQLKPDDLIVAPHDCYGGTHRLLTRTSDLGHFRVKFADLTDSSKRDEAFSEPPQVVLIETPSNPLLRITDIKAVAARAKESGALVVADNTFLSPILQNPLDHGADIVVHSTTKYINGHSDVVGGAVVLSTEELYKQYASWANVTGVAGAPFDSWLTLRGIRTLDVRIREQQKTAQSIAEYLSDHPGVFKVYYPGLSTHPGHAIAQKQQKGFGAMLSFELAKPELVEPFVNRLTGVGKIFSLAESLGGFESLVANCASMTHASMNAEARRKAGISDSLLRVSIGLETEDDLKGALNDAFASVGVKRPPVKPRTQGSRWDPPL
jgi:cystathionine gamma-synthase